MTEYSTIPNPEISRPFAMPLRFLGNIFSSRSTDYPLLEEQELVSTVSKITENDLTMLMNFDKNNFFILYPNPTVSAKIVGAMD